MLEQLVKAPEFTAMLQGCKGKAETAADGKTANCMMKDPSGASMPAAAFEKLDEEWYLGM